MKVDPYKHKEKYLSWKARTEGGVPGITKASAVALKCFLSDMEQGVNIAAGTKKGARGYPRLNNLRQRLLFIAKNLEETFKVKSLVEVKEQQIHGFFNGMRSGGVTRRDGGVYRSTADYVNVFKTFWHWHMKVERKKGNDVPDICVDLDNSKPKPEWVYLTEKQVRLLCQRAKYEYRVLMMFLYDSGIRSPTELVNVRVRDLAVESKQLCIRDEASKTFGRTINLLLSSGLLKEYIEAKCLGEFDQIFPICPSVVNRYLRRLATRVLGQSESPAGSKYSALTMYDFRHSSACYWLPRYKTESALKYRFGWKRSEMIHYYTEFLGMRDTIQQEDLFVGAEKTEVEKRLEKSENAKTLLEEELATMREQMKHILGVVNSLAIKTKPANLATTE